MCSHVTRISNSTYQNSVHYKFSAPYFALIINNYFVSVLRDLSTEPVECFLVAKVGMDWVALLAQCRDRARFFLVSSRRSRKNRAVPLSLRSYLGASGPLARQRLDFIARISTARTVGKLFVHLRASSLRGGQCWTCGGRAAPPGRTLPVPVWQPGTGSEPQTQACLDS